MKHYCTQLILACLILVVVIGCSKANQPEAFRPSDTGIQLNVPDTHQVTSAGICIAIENVKSPISNALKLLISGTYGTTVLRTTSSNGITCFKIPPELSRHAGVLSYNLIEGITSLQKGNLKLVADTTNLGKLENYLGPRSLIANPRDYTMLVSVPTDYLDNLLPDHTMVTMKQQFKDRQVSTPTPIKNGFAWQNSAAPLRTGRITTASTIDATTSKELVADVYSDLAKEIRLNIEQVHPYADGNALISFKTGQLKDLHDNILSDGTLVYFYMKNMQGKRWKTTATTQNGYAVAQVLHPEFPTSWKVEAVIKGIAQSQTITIDFKPITDSLPLHIENRTLQVGPLTSYLGQQVPDGISVEIETELGRHLLKTRDGMVVFQLNPQEYKSGTYRVRVKALGLTTQKTCKID